MKNYPAFMPMLARISLLLTINLFAVECTLLGQTRPTIEETYDEPFDEFNVDKPIGWNLVGDSSGVIVNKGEGYIGLRSLSKKPYGWISPRLGGGGGGILHDINHSIYHRRQPENFPKRFRLNAKIKARLDGEQGYFVIRIQWFDKQSQLAMNEYRIDKEYSAWTPVDFSGMVPPSAQEYQLTITGPDVSAEKKGQELLIDELSMKILFEDEPVVFPTNDELRHLKINFPLNVREWHFYWHTWRPNDWPEMYTSNINNDPHVDPFALHLDREAWFVRRDDWQRDINSPGYPLIGPYDPSDKEIIKWQLQTMKNSGLQGAFVHLWPTYRGKEKYGDYYSIFDRLLDEAEKIGAPVAIFDEYWGNNSAEDADGLIELLRGRIDKKGYYCIKGKPAVWMQNWWNRYTPDELRELMAKVESGVGRDLYWIVALVRLNYPIPAGHERFLAIRDIDCVDFRYAAEEIAKNNKTGDVSWYAMKEGLKDFMSFLNSSPIHHDWSASIEPGYSTVGDVTRNAQALYAVSPQLPTAETSKPATQAASAKFDVGADGRTGAANRYKIMPYMKRDYGLTLLKELYLISQQKQQPAFITIKSWNDYQEYHAIEPGYHYEGDSDFPLGQNQDPYFYTKLVAQVTGKSFVPAPLPPADHLDPLIHRELSPSEVSADLYGPLFTKQAITDERFNCEIKDARSPISKLWQDKLPAAGFNVGPSRKLDQWGLSIANFNNVNGGPSVTQVGDQPCLTVNHGTKLRLSISDEMIKTIPTGARVFVVFSYFDAVPPGRTVAAAQFEYLTTSGKPAALNRSRIYNSNSWKWGIKCLYNAELKHDRVVDISSLENDPLFIRSLYLVIPGVSKGCRELTPVDSGRYSVPLDSLTQNSGTNEIAILYTQDGSDQYGNLLVVDIKNKRLLPDKVGIITTR